VSDPPFRILHSSRPFRGELVTVRTDRVADVDGRTASREVAEHPGAVAALVVDEDGRVLLVDQWRHAVGGRLLEVAAGKYDVGGEPVEQTLRRELAEELGVEGGTLTWLASFYTTPGWSDEVLDLYLAEGMRPLGGGAAELHWEEAGLEVVRVPYEEALALATSTQPGDAKTLVASASTGSSGPGCGPRTPRDARRPTPPLGGPTPAPPTDRLGPSARRRVGPACGNPRRGWKGRAAWTLASRAS